MNYLSDLPVIQTFIYDYYFRNKYLIQMEPVVLNDSAARGGNPHPLEHLHQRQDSKILIYAVFDHGIFIWLSIRL